MTHNANSKTVAIEFAEYMAKSAERFIAAANAVDAMRGGETHPDDGVGGYGEWLKSGRRDFTGLSKTQTLPPRSWNGRPTASAKSCGGAAASRPE